MTKNLNEAMNSNLNTLVISLQLGTHFYRKGKMLLLWHEALGSDDEQAEENELCARVLYFQKDRGDSADLLQSLHFIQGLLMFVRMLRCKGRDGMKTGWTPDWASVTLSKRKFFIQEVEPQIFMALGVYPTVEIKDNKSGYKALVQELYDMFRLFYGSFGSNLRMLPCTDKGERIDVNFTDGMDLLKEIGLQQKRLRKLRLDIKNRTESDDAAEDINCSNAASEVQNEIYKTEAELKALQALSPASILQQKCNIFFPTLLQALDTSGCSGLHELQGLGYFPMDQNTFLSVQLFVNGFQKEFSSAGEFQVESSALFFKGNLLWTSIDTATMKLLYNFLRLREERGMTLIRSRDNNEVDQVNVNQNLKKPFDSELWMANAYEDTFRPIWSSKLSYAECDVVTLTAKNTPYQRRAARSLHKQHPVSLTTFLSEMQSSSSTGLASISSPIASLSHSSSSFKPYGESWSNKATSKALVNAMKARARPTSYQNGGLLRRDGQFFKISSANEEISSQRAFDDAKAVWSPHIFPLSDASVSSATKGTMPRHRVVLWHEEDLTIMILLSFDKMRKESSDESISALATTFKRLNDYFEHQERFLNLAQLILTRFNATYTPEKNLPNRSPLPPFLYINRVNLAFRMRGIPRILKRAKDDLFPIPVKLLAHYFPASTLALLNEFHAELHNSSSAGNREICVRTRHAGWVLAKKSETSHRELYVFFDNKISSVSNLSDSLQMLLHDQFGNVFF
ncbi:Putative myrosinase precursor [Plasmopara halstedii]|uniref:Putative myrosinase n=1 Tax=Plasmopara halstedii TaxID=4781 RepID=A0A0P1AIE0_PLAHL|nr:Putative myrosinase precursor [Plasmopara halstedii]CEG40962.1 Putative myrosinase precursor [Plasmopara halstedii]|eukprot:XP_024577331.1 Putative myrosinase precursor [Plasmopara halstedii]